MPWKARGGEVVRAALGTGCERALFEALLKRTRASGYRQSGRLYHLSLSRASLADRLTDSLYWR